MKSLIKLWQQVSLDVGLMCHVSTTRDFKTVAGRFEHEGVSFLTITLTDFGKGLEKALDRGSVDHDLFPGFRFRGGLPQFLGGFLDLVFDRKSGRLLDEPNETAIYAVRQLTLMFGKILIECSPARSKAALVKFVECEQDVRSSDRTITPGLLDRFSVMSLKLFGDVLAAVDREVYDGTLTPKHGPGKTADKLSGNRKFDQVEWPRRLDSVFPFGDYCLPNWRFNYLLDSVSILEPGHERPVKVTLVPKSLKTPRIIAIEPTCMQYMQQALMMAIVPALEGDSLVSSMIGFTDQVPNQHMAREGSRTGGLATIDLSEASDRVSNQHVRVLLKHFPHLFEAVDASRSRKADVPGFGVMRLAKFASMGSALCFPIEAMVFLTIVMMAIEHEHGRRFTRADISRFRGRVRVYGDDIIVPTEYMRAVVDHLEAFGLKVNLSKSFGTGRFRESCGKEYYNGTDVSITKVRSLFPVRQLDATEVIATVSLRNRLFEAGLTGAARWMDPGINHLLGGWYPAVTSDSPILGRIENGAYECLRMDPDTQVPQVKGFCVSPKLPASMASGEGSLLKWFLKRGDEPFADRDHLVRSGRPDAVTLKLRWASAA